MPQVKKVVLPREVAEALRGLELRHGEMAPYDLAQIHSLKDDNHNCFVINEYSRNNPQKYFSALVNGYETERTPEDKVREYYESNDYYLTDSITEKHRVIGRKQGVRKTLDLLGITIEGVND